jgi:hypothetical protein
VAGLRSSSAPVRPFFAMIAAPRPGCGRAAAPRPAPGSSRPAAGADAQGRAHAPGGRQEFARDHPRALMDQLVEGVLAVGAGLAPDHGAGVGAGRCRPSPRACRCSPSPAAEDRQAGAQGAGHRAARRGWCSRRSGCARCRPAPAAPAGSARKGAVGNGWSIARPPARKSSKASGPTAIISASPIGPHIE